MHDNKWFDLNCQLYFEPHKAVSTVPKSLSKISPNEKNLLSGHAVLPNETFECGSHSKFNCDKIR